MRSTFGINNYRIKNKPTGNRSSQSKYAKRARVSINRLKTIRIQRGNVQCRISQSYKLWYNFPNGKLERYVLKRRHNSSPKKNLQLGERESVTAFGISNFLKNVLFTNLIRSKRCDDDILLFYSQMTYQGVKYFRGPGVRPRGHNLMRILSVPKRWNASVKECPDGHPPAGRQSGTIAEKQKSGPGQKNHRPGINFDLETKLQFSNGHRKRIDRRSHLFHGILYWKPSWDI